MARLTRLQLRAIFAKLKGAQTAYVRKRAKSVRIAPAHLSEVELDSVMSADVIDRLVRRLPRAHRSLAPAHRIEIRDHVLGGMYNRHVGSWTGRDAPNPKHRFRLRLTRNPAAYMKEVGYTKKPSHIPAGFWASKERSRLPLSDEARKRHTLRNARVGARKAFYHEYGHALWDSLQLSETHFRNRWTMRGLQGEWRDPRVVIVGRINPQEAFAEAYSQYAFSKVSRTRLQRERPMSYDFIDHFFRRTYQFMAGE